MPYVYLAYFGAMNTPTYSTAKKKKDVRLTYEVENFTGGSS